MAKKTIWQKGYTLRKGNDGLYYVANIWGRSIKSSLRFTDYRMAAEEPYVQLGGIWHTLSDDGKELKNFVNLQEIAKIDKLEEDMKKKIKGKLQRYF